MLLDEIMAETYPAPDPAKDLPVEPPFQKVVRVWREVPSPSEAAVSNFLQHHEPSPLVQPQEQSKDQPQDQPNEQYLEHERYRQVLPRQQEREQSKGEPEDQPQE